MSFSDFFTQYNALEVANVTNTNILFFLGLNNVPLYIYSTASLYSSADGQIVSISSNSRVQDIFQFICISSFIDVLQFSKYSSFTSFLKFSLWSSINLLSSVSIFMTSTSNSLSGKLIYLCFIKGSFVPLRFYLVLSLKYSCFFVLVDFIRIQEMKQLPLPILKEK